MGSYGCIILVACALFALAVADRKDVFEECKKSTNASEEDIKTIFSHKPLETRESMCFLACLQEKMGIIKDGKIVAEEMKKVIQHEMKRHKMDPKTEAAVMQNVDKCSEVTDSDKCELVGKFTKCMYDAKEASETKSD